MRHYIKYQTCFLCIGRERETCAAANLNPDACALISGRANKKMAMLLEAASNDNIPLMDINFMAFL